MLQVDRAPEVRAYFGATGCGKSHEVKARLLERADPRLITIDPDGEYAAIAPVYLSLSSLTRSTAESSTFRVGFIPSDDRDTGIEQFNFLCRLAWERAQQHGSVCFAVDELADFTEPNAAPRYWRRLVRRGRKYGVSVFAISQRPADVDKTIFSNASMIRTGRLNRANDQVELARSLNVPLAQVAALSGFDFIERDGHTGELRSSASFPP